MKSDREYGRTGPLPPRAEERGDRDRAVELWTPWVTGWAGVVGPLTRGSTTTWVPVNVRKEGWFGSYEYKHDLVVLYTGVPERKAVFPRMLGT